ncbi:type VII secretion protein EccE [Mycobacterium asiaticum]|uniref:Type VII secretion protein EccE n=1 Tax=Mycobacterium asiaticum TaxID=1790 RepID=A0A1A3L393_MYCAS|nr:type VII secretion protein EccE [Mycobacterium asiaticum]OBJ91078.1 type VII secretion protein EccE [Mycobacterium asiaticum]
MTPASPVGLALGWSRLVAVFVADVALLGVGTVAGGRSGWWVGLIAAVLITAAALGCWRGAPVLTLAWRAVGARRGVLGVPAGRLADHERTFGSGPVGIRAVGAHLVAVVAVDGQPHSPSVLDYPRVVSMTALPLETVAAGLRQFDVRLEGIDVLSVGSRRAPRTHHPYAEAYSSEVGDHPAVGQRRTWLVVRLNAASSARAVLWRESVAATLTAAAEWVVQELTNLRIGARVLTADQIRTADQALLAGAESAELAPRWGHLRHPGGYVHTYWMSPRDINDANIDRLWTPDTQATVVSVQLRLTPAGATTVGVAVRYHSGSVLPEPPLSGLNPFTGRHDGALRAGMITADTVMGVPARELPAGQRLRMPIGASGIIIGATASGHPLLIDLLDPTGPATMTIAGELALTAAIARRAAATGYQVQVCTQRPHRWKEITATGLQVMELAALAQQSLASGAPVLVVFDEVDGPIAQGAAVTVRIIAATSSSSADVHLAQDGPGHAVLRTWAIADRLRIDITEERRLTATVPASQPSHAVGRRAASVAEILR